MANIKRTRIKKRPNSLYKTVVIVENDPNNTVTNVEVSLPAQHGITPTPTDVTLEQRNTKPNGNTRYVNRHITMEGGDPNGLPFSLVATMKDATGTTVGTPETISVTVQDNDGINITGVALRLNEDETFTLRAVVKGTDKGLVSTISALLTPDDGGSDADPDEFALVLTKETDTKRVFKNEVVEFLDAGNVIDMAYIAAITLFDANGEELDYAEFRIVGLE